MLGVFSWKVKPPLFDSKVKKKKEKEIVEGEHHPKINIVAWLYFVQYLQFQRRCSSHY